MAKPPTCGTRGTRSPTTPLATYAGRNSGWYWVTAAGLIGVVTECLEQPNQDVDENRDDAGEDERENQAARRAAVRADTYLAAGSGSDGGGSSTAIRSKGRIINGSSRKWVSHRYPLRPHQNSGRCGLRLVLLACGHLGSP